MGASATFAADEAARRPAWTTSRITGSPLPPEPYRLVPFAGNIKFNRPTCIEQIPSSNRLLVTEISGKVFTLDMASKDPQAELAGDLSASLSGDLAKRGVSLWDAACHFDFRNNGYLFVCYVHPGDGGHTRVSRFEMTREAIPQLKLESELVYITWPSGGHNGGCLEFAPNGYLYISTGDGSGPNPPDGLTTGQDVSDLLGAVLRIDPNQSEGEKPYRIPDDNPFVDVPNARPEIWSYGLRNPWKFGVDPKTGDVLVADNGWESWEMVHKVTRGSNCGWPVMEGRVALRSEVPVGPTPIVPPIKDHPHSEANSVIGGPVYRGDQLPQLDGAFVYGDYITGTIWAVRKQDGDALAHQTLVDTDQRIIAFTQTAKGQLLVLDYDYTGRIYELVRSDVPDTSSSFPRRLSDTGLFTSIETLQPAPGVIPYSVVASRWMDGAEGERWVAIPGQGVVDLEASSVDARFPEGTVLVKHLTLPGIGSSAPIRLETQILHYERGSWRPYSYVWDDDGRDATLAEPTGRKRQLRVHGDAQSGNGNRTWHVSAVNECKLCHNAESGFALGFKPNQLDRLTQLGGQSGDQLSMLTKSGVLKGSLPAATIDPARLVDPHDPSQTIEDRARSYLHANCAMCHQPGGNAIVSFFLRRDLPFERLNTNKGTGIGTFGIRDARIIAAGDPYSSILIYRMSKLGYARMPYIGSHVVDGRGVAIVQEWIRSLPADSQRGLSSPLVADSPEQKALAELQNATPSSSDKFEGVVKQLLASTEGSLALAGLLHSESLPRDRQQMAIAVANTDPRSDIRGLFQTFLPESQRRATLGATIDPKAISGLDGDAERGKLIYYSDTARCRACHEMDDASQSLGPTLKEIVKKYPRQDELLQHVLQPSLKIDEPLAAYTVVTQDGRALAGLIVERTNEHVVVKTAEKKTVRLAANEIDSIDKSSKSLMPDFVLGDLTAQEAADLFAYIRSIGSPSNPEQ